MLTPELKRSFAKALRLTLSFHCVSNPSYGFIVIMRCPSLPHLFDWNQQRWLQRGDQAAMVLPCCDLLDGSDAAIVRATRLMRSFNLRVR